MTKRNTIVILTYLHLWFGGLFHIFMRYSLNENWAPSLMFLTWAKLQVMVIIHLSLIMILYLLSLAAMLITLAPDTLSIVNLLKLIITQCCTAIKWSYFFDFVVTVVLGSYLIANMDDG